MRLRHLQCIGLGLCCLFGCSRSSPSAAHAPALRTTAPGITLINATDTAAYAELGPEALAAVARCRSPKCRPDIFRGPGAGELTVGLDSGRGAEFQWHRPPDAPPPGGQAFQDSAWTATLSHWEKSTPAPLLLIDGVPRSYAYAREHVAMSSVSGIREVSAKDAKALSSDPAAAHGAVVIDTKGHAPTTPH